MTLLLQSAPYLRRMWAASAVLALLTSCGDAPPTPATATTGADAEADVDNNFGDGLSGDAKSDGSGAKDTGSVADSAQPADGAVKDSGGTSGCVSDNDCVGVISGLAACEKAVCDSGKCAIATVANGTACDDGNACFTGRTCKNGACSGGKAKNCDDGNPCTDNKCDSQQGCVATNNAVPCNDGDPCTADDSCKDGKCQPGKPSCGNTGKELDCGDTLDNDGDGNVDCADNDCAGSAACAVLPAETVCGDGKDDDGDGKTDCQDSDCAAAAGCQKPAKETACSDGLDDDGDGAIDCNDNDCAADPACLLTPVKETSCADQVDDDKDGAIDCKDDDCLADAACKPAKETACGDGKDDDLDGAIDCKDNDCGADPACAQGPTVEANCGDKVDDDKDGKIDCQDSDCAKDAACVAAAKESACADKQDNDNDGAVDCNDIDCSADAACKSGATCDVCTQNPKPLTKGCDPCVDQVCAADPFCCQTAWDNICVGEVDTICKKQCAAPATETACTDKTDNDKDGKVDCQDTDCAKDAACAGKETNCTDKVDDDKDGLTDCQDSDCAADAACKAAVCVEAGSAVCGVAATQNNAAKGSTSALSAYTCVDGKTNGNTGSEYTYAYTAECDGPVTFTLNKQGSQSGFLDLFVLDAAKGCAATSCLQHGLMSGSQATVTYIAKKGQKLLLVVDGYQGFSGDFTLKIACGCVGGKETACTDKADNDGDGKADCLDSDCAGDATCIPTTETLCADKLDNDNDGQVDCADSDCAKDAACAAPATELLCADKIDNDKDGQLDCADSDCAKDAACAPPTVEKLCADKLDDDKDGLVDCADPDCAGNAACLCTASYPLTCGGSDSWSSNGSGSTKKVNAYVCPDGKGGSTTLGSETGSEYSYAFTATCDGDLTVSVTKTAATQGFLDLFILDGAKPCGGNACVGYNLMGTTSATQTVAVKNGQKLNIVVDGYNGYAGSYSIKTSCKCAVTVETNCTDKLDDDKDGQVDCADSDCAKNPACLTPLTETLCTDKVDNDKDGQVDCADSDCAKDLACAPPTAEKLCADKLDNDKDGKTDCADSDCVQDAGCIAAVSCKADFPLTCGGADTYANDGPNSTKNISSYACADGSVSGETGSEYTYEYVAPQDGNVTVTLTKQSGTSGYLDLFVLDAVKGCNANACTVHNLMSSGTAKVTFTAKKGAKYFIVVDGYNGYASSYSLKIDCAAPSTETSCTDKVDNDKDGKLDCADSDCAKDAACAALCTPDYTMACGKTDQYSNDGPGSSNAIVSWTCADGASNDYTGPEYTYNFTASCTGKVTATVKRMTAGGTGYLDLFVLDGAQTCGAQACKSHALMLGDTATKTFDATAGQKFFLVVDGYKGAVEDYQLDIKCACP